jgi:hypothetical protein
VHLGLKIQHNIQAGLPAVRAPKGKHQAMAQQVNNCIGSLVVGGGWGVGGTGRGVSETAPAPPAAAAAVVAAALWFVSRSTAFAYLGAVFRVPLRLCAFAGGVFCVRFRSAWGLGIDK